MTKAVKLMNRVFYRWYDVIILVTLDMNKQEFYAQLNNDYTSTQVVQSHRIQEWLFLIVSSLWEVDRALGDLRSSKSTLTGGDR